MQSSDEILADVRAQKLAHQALWRSIPTCHPAKALFWPESLSEDEQALAAALADVTSEIEHVLPTKDRWYQYGDNEKTEFCFGSDVKVPGTRFSDGSFPVWYGASSQEASKAEVAYHLTRQAMHELRFTTEESIVVFERAMCKAEVRLEAGLNLLRLAEEGHPGLLEDGPPYPFCQRLGKTALARGADGLVTLSVRSKEAENWAVWRKDAVRKSIVKNFWDLAVHRSGERRICGEPVGEDDF